MSTCPICAGLVPPKMGGRGKPRIYCSRRCAKVNDKRKHYAKYSGYPVISGFIYGLTHPSFPGFVKVGRAVDLKGRLSGYNTGCPSNSYQFSWVIPVEDTHRGEQRAHDRLWKHQVKPEWFALSAEAALTLLKDI